MSKILIKRGAVSKWTSRQLDYGELGLDLTNNLVKIGKKQAGTFAEALPLNPETEDYGDLDV